MKKISIAGQLVLLFILVLLCSSTAFTILTFSRMYYVAEQETYSRLITYSMLLNTNPIEAEPADFRDMDVVYIHSKNGTLEYSNDILEFVNEDKIKQLLKEAKDKKDTSKIVTLKFKNEHNRMIYCVITSGKDAATFTILLTNSRYITSMVRNISSSVIVVFFIIFILCVTGVIVWANHFARRIHRIQEHILSLPRTGYEASYIDDYGDEIGELSWAVESMRKEINESEQTKQEMLQNISHDFKTPIAVIQSYAEAQQDGMAGEDSSKIIIHQADILKHKVNRLLQYNSLEYLKKDREFEDVDMKEVVEEVICGYKFQTDIEIVLDLTDNIYFKGYRENYYTVVDNIIDNARRYAKTKIKIVLKKDRLRIYNDGEAIDETFIRNSFKPYEKGSKGEFGLGMSIVKKTVEFFGMELIVKNETIGVSFIITKP